MRDQILLLFALVTALVQVSTSITASPPSVEGADGQEQRAAVDDPLRFDLLVAKGLEYYDDERLNDADTAFAEAIATMDKHSGSGSVQYWWCRLLQGQLKSLQKDDQDALAILNEVERGLLELHGDDKALLLSAACAANKSLILSELGRYREAEATADQLHFEETKIKGHMAVAVGVAIVGAYAEASCFDKAERCLTKLNGVIHSDPDLYNKSFPYGEMAKARLCTARGKYQDALQCYGNALAWIQQAEGSHYLLAADIAERSALVKERMGNYGAAEELRAEGEKLRATLAEKNKTTKVAF